MSDPMDISSKRHRAWYVHHLLAALSALLLIGMLGWLLVLIGAAPHAAAHDLVFSSKTAKVFPRVAPILGVCLLAALWFWVAMLRHYLQNRAVVSRSWLLWLIASNWGAAIAYFLVVWRPQAQRGST